MKFWLLVLGTVICANAVSGGPANWILLWPGTNLLALGLAHFRGWHRLFGKRADGTLAGSRVVLFLPLLALTWSSWHLFRICSPRGSAISEINPQLFVSRRLLSPELPPGFANIIDLTAEFHEPRMLRQAPGYRCLPLLDACAPPVGQLRALLRELMPGHTLVHCAQGYGRSGLVALAILLDREVVTSVSAGLQLLTAARPGVRLNAEQTLCAERLAQELALERNA